MRQILEGVGADFSGRVVLPYMVGLSEPEIGSDLPARV